MDEFDPTPSKGKTRTVAILLLVLLLVGVVGVYVSGASLKSILFGISSDAGEKVGVVKAVTGQLKRQPKDSLEFLSTSANSDLYGEDTIMTGPADYATIELFDGSNLELEPGSLIRLSFESTQGVGGIERRVLVDIVAGNVKGDMTRPKLVVRRGGQTISRPAPPPAAETPKDAPAASDAEVSPAPMPTLEPSAEPSPEPSPTPVGLVPDAIKFSQPTPNQVLSVPAGQRPPVKQALVFETPSIPEAGVMMILRNAAGKEVLNKTVTATSGRGGLLATFERPGRYSLELKNPDGTDIGSGMRVPFSVASAYTGIEVEPPFVGGQSVDSNRFTGQAASAASGFNVVFRWKPVENITQYRIVIKDKAGAKLVEAPVVGTAYSFVRPKVSTDPVTYQVFGTAPSGYVANSKSETFTFAFDSPVQALPTNGETVSLTAQEVVRQNGIFFSWQRTTYTETYEFEIAFDAEFKRVMKRVSVKQQDNFLVFRNLKPREYWWRVRAVAGTLKSAPLPGFKITVTP